MQRKVKVYLFILSDEHGYYNVKIESYLASFKNLSIFLYFNLQARREIQEKALKINEIAHAMEKT